MIAADFNDPAVLADPYPVLARMREAAPVQWNESLAAWCVLRHADVRAGFRDPRLSAERVAAFARHAGPDQPDIAYLGACIGLWMVFNDPPTHTRLRRLVQLAFLPQAIEALRPAIAQRTDALLAKLTAKGRDADLVADFAGPLPALVIGDMLGVPEADLPALQRWSEDVARFVLTSRADRDKYPKAAAALREMNGYFAELVAMRRKEPGDRIIDGLIAARDGDDALSEDELLAAIVLLLFAGHETTTHFLSAGYRALAAHEAVAASLRSGRADGEQARRVASEVLRWDGPVVAISRVATQSFGLGGCDIHAGQPVYLFIASANRDPAAFRDPDRLDPDRPDLSRLITFGFGLHTCLGLHLAMLEGEIALPRVADALAGWTIAPVPLAFTSTLVVRGVKSLPLRRA